MMELRNIARAIPLLAAALILTLPLAGQAAKPSGAGGGNKVSVTAANPPDAFQGEELDVIVSGSGFDQGSEVSYLVTGTTDSSQVEVLSVEVISSSELKTRIRPKDAALPTEYDIEVRTTSGRKGKGTTLFSVKRNEETCVDGEFPTIAYTVRSEFVKKKGRFDEPPPQNVMLTGDNACTEYTLVPNYPWPGGTFRDLKFAAMDGLGVVSWIEATATDELGVSTQRIKGVFFDILEGGGIAPAQPNPVVLHEVLRGTAENTYLASHDIRLDSDGSWRVALIDFALSAYRNLRILDPVDGDSLLLEGAVHFFESQGNPYYAAHDVRWHPGGSALYFQVTRSDAERVAPGVGRIVYRDGEWLAPELIVADYQYGNDGMRNAGLSADGRLAYHYLMPDDGWRRTGIVDAELCLPLGCDVLDGAPPTGVDREGMPIAWTAPGSLVFTIPNDPIREWANPELGIRSELSIENAEYLDTSYQE